MPNRIRPNWAGRVPLPHSDLEGTRSRNGKNRTLGLPRIIRLKENAPDSITARFM